MTAFAQNPEYSGRPYLWQDKKYTIWNLPKRNLIRS